MRIRMRARTSGCVAGGPSAGYQSGMRMHRADDGPARCAIIPGGGKRGRLDWRDVVNVYAAPGVPRPSSVYVPVGGCQFQEYRLNRANANLRG
jgi:hypothetical protein